MRLSGAHKLNNGFARRNQAASEEEVPEAA